LDIRKAHDWSAKLGVPAHLTVVGPFLPPRAISQDVLRRLGAIFSGQPPVSVSLDRMRRLGDAACLVRMAGLKPQEIRCLLLNAEGLSYQEICQVTGFSYTNANSITTTVAWNSEASRG
jgi:hypothetical protein